MLAFIKKKIGLSPDTEEQCSCCNAGSDKSEERPGSRCGCGESVKSSGTDEE
jgi:hypothetical protein